MVWFRVDDGWHKHRKRIRTGLDLEGMAAQGLWAAAGSWCGDELSDGFIPDDVVDYLAPGVGQVLAKRLEAARLWVRGERDGETGWEFHQWVEQQPTREEVEAVATKKSSGGKLGNHRRWHTEAGKFDPKCPFCKEEAPPPAKTRRRTSNRSSDRTSNRSSDRSTDGSSKSGANPPTRPDPTRPEVLPEPLFEDPPPEGGAKAPRRSRKKPTEDDPDEAARAQTAKDVVAAFIDGARERDRTVTDDVIGQVGATAKRILKSGKVTAPQLIAAAKSMGRNGYKDLNQQLLTGASNDYQGRRGSSQHVPYRDPEDISRYKTSKI